MARQGRLIFSFITICLFLNNCSFSVAPLYNKNNLASVVKQKIKEELSQEATTKLVGSTFWVYLPQEGLFDFPKDPPIVFKRFSPLDAKVKFSSNKKIFVSYNIKSMPEKKEKQTTVFSKKAIRAIGNVWQIIRKVSFSMDKESRKAVQFYCVVTSDILNGVDVIQIAYAPDLARLSFVLIQVPEFQRRIITEPIFAPQAIGDTKGEHIEMKDFTFEEFITLQIRNRILNRFQIENSKTASSKRKPMSDSEIAREVVRIVKETLKIYNWRKFSKLEIYNGLNGETRVFEYPDIFN
ncbi:MAG: hypothetical protein N2606_01740 [Candidatus Omnitrophica bacterium]|nr:hypothetical protein [Candidatus Omnitrophota bacterium]